MFRGWLCLREAKETDLAAQMPRSRLAEINATWGGVKEETISRCLCVM